MERKTIVVAGTFCPDSERAVETTLRGVEGVRRIEPVREADVVEIVGYDVDDGRSDAIRSERRVPG